MEIYFLIGLGVTAFAGIVVFALWQSNKSAATAGAAKVEAAQATAEAAANRAALGEAVQEVTDDDVVKSLRGNTF